MGSMQLGLKEGKIEVREIIQKVSIMIERFLWEWERGLDVVKDKEKGVGIENVLKGKFM